MGGGPEARIPWKKDAQDLLRPYWGTTNPLTTTQLMSHVIDASGRPVLEKEKPNPAGVPFEFRDSPYHDIRTGRKVNASAFEQVALHFDEALGVLSYLRSVIHPYSKKPNFEDISDVVHAGAVLSRWLVLRADNPMRNGEVPIEVGVLTKMSRGLSVPFDKVYLARLRALHQGAEHTRVGDVSFLDSVDSYLNLIFEEELLNNDKDGIACPATQHMIRASIKALLVEPSDRANEMRIRLGLSDKEIKRVRKLGLAVRVLYTETTAQNSILLELLEEIVDGDPTLLGNPKTRRARGKRYVEKANTALRWANESLGRDLPSKVAVEDVFSYS